MKVKLLVLLMVVAGTARADGPSWVFPKNPDQRASIGFDFSRSYEDGYGAPYTTRTNALGTFTDKTHYSLGATAYTFDLRVPVHDRVTLSVHGGPGNQEYDGQRISGYSVGAGARFYLGS